MGGIRRIDRIPNAWLREWNGVKKMRMKGLRKVSPAVWAN